MSPRPTDDEPPPEGPPGGRIFSLEDRRAPGLYLVAWLLSLGGAALLFVATLSSADVGRALLGISGATLLAVGLAAGAGYQVVERRDRHPERYRGPSPVLAFGVVLAWTSIVSALVLGTGWLDPGSPFGFLTGLLVVAGGYAAVVWLFAVRSGALTWADMGWPSGEAVDVRRALRSVGVAIAVMLPSTLVVLVVGGQLGRLLGVEAPLVLPTPREPAEALAVAVAAAVVAPVGEELFFRGFALSAWLRDLGARAALVRSAVFFALIHIVNITSSSFAEGAAQALLQTVVILPVGLVLGVLFLRHGMAGAISGHVTYNTLLLVLLLVGSRLAPPA